MFKLRSKTVTNAVFLVTFILLSSVLSASAENTIDSQQIPKVGVDSANPREGSPANVLASGFRLKLLAQGSDPLENPSGTITKFGYLNDFPPQTVEATKTEADQNTYLVLDYNPGGPTPGYDYGRRFLFQGHENGNDTAYVTRINLDVTDPSHLNRLGSLVAPKGECQFL